MKLNSQQIKKHSADLALVLCVIGALSGCSAVKSGSNDIKDMTVEPAPNAGFIENPEQNAKITFLPFQRAWISPDFDKRNYNELVVAPVNTHYMLKMDWLHDMSTASWFGGVKKDIAELAVYFHDQIVKDFKEDPKQRFQIIDSAAQGTGTALQLEIALVEIDPSMPVLHAAGWLTPGGGTAAGAVNQRRAAFEGRLRDLQTGKVVATFADRNMQDVGPLDLTRLTWYGPAQGIMDMWS